MIVRQFDTRSVPDPDGNVEERETELNVVCSQLYQLLSVIQGIALHHTTSKVYLGRRYPLEVRYQRRWLTLVLSPSADSSNALDDLTTYIHYHTIRR